MKRKLTAEEFDAFAETGKSLLPHLKLETAHFPNRRGGTRPGAGRKPSGRAGRTVRLSERAWKHLDRTAAAQGRSVSEVIETLTLA